jgi:hypothetical protein
MQLDDPVAMLASGDVRRAALRAKLAERTKKRKREAEYDALLSAFEAQTQRVVELEGIVLKLALEVSKSRRLVREANDEVREAAGLGEAVAPQTAVSLARPRTRGEAFVAKLRADAK